MSFEYLIDPAKGPQCKGVLPGKPAPYVLRKGEGEHAIGSPDAALRALDRTTGVLRRRLGLHGRPLTREEDR